MQGLDLKYTHSRIDPTDINSVVVPETNTKCLPYLHQHYLLGQLNKKTPKPPSISTYGMFRGTNE